MKFVNINIIFSLLLCCILSTCCNCPIRFNKTCWNESEHESGMYIIGNKRYRMALWVEENYTFTGKTATEIVDMFVNGRDAALKIAERDKKIEIYIRSHNPHWVLDMFPNPNAIVPMDW